MESVLVGEYLLSFYNKTFKILFPKLKIYKYLRVYNYNYDKSRVSMVLEQPNGFLIGFYEFLDLFMRNKYQLFHSSLILN